MAITHLISTQQWHRLAADLLDRQVSNTLELVTPATVLAVIQRRSQILQKLQASHGADDDLVANIWYGWIPLAEYLIKTHHTPPFVQGIVGGQGTGKTTLAKFLQRILQIMGYDCLHLSLDDLYKTYSDRLVWQATHPQIKWRGVPSTHDVELGIHSLQQFRTQPAPWQIPRFDKSLHHGMGDRLKPEIITTKPQIILFEGWFVGVQPVNPEQINDPFVQTMNHYLHAYQPLWQLLNSLWYLQPPDYRLSLAWRQQAEINGMDQSEVAAFVQFFWRSLPPEIFMAPLAKSAHLTITIDAHHQITAITPN